MARSDWQVYAAQALREGRTLREASRSWHDANRRVFNNPSSPESRYHHHRRKAVGELLKRNVSFSEARRLVDRGFDGYQRVGHQVERGIVHAGERRNPDGGTNWLLIGGIAALAWWLAQRQATPTASSNGPGPWLAAGAPPEIGRASCR